MTVFIFFNRREFCAFRNVYSLSLIHIFCVSCLTPTILIHVIMLYSHINLSLIHILSVCRIFSMENNNSRKFNQNQIMFCIQPWIVEDSRPIVFGEDRLRERGSLPATFYVLTRVKCLIFINKVFWKEGCLLYTSRCV